MTIAHYQTTENQIKKLLNPDNTPVTKVGELITRGEDIADLLSQFPPNYTVYNIGETLIIKSPFIHGNCQRWRLLYENNGTPYWKEFLES